MTAPRTAPTCACGSTAWRMGTTPVAKDKDSYSLPRTCRECGETGPNQVIYYQLNGRRAWDSAPEKKQAPQPPAAKETTMQETPKPPQRGVAPTVHTATQILKERLSILIPQVQDITVAKKEAEQIHASLTALGEQLEPLPWKKKP